MPSGRLINITGTPSTPRFIRVVSRGRTLESNSTTQSMFNIWDFATNSPGTGGSIASFVANLKTALSGDLCACCTEDFKLVDWIGQYLDDPANPKVIEADGADGSVAVDRAASFTAGVIRKISGFTGRSWRGSWHIGAVPESFTQQDQLNATGQAAYNQLRTDIGSLISSGLSDGAQTFYPFIISTIQSNLTATPAVITGAYIASTELNLKLGTMKRRKQGVGT